MPEQIILERPWSMLQNAECVGEVIQLKSVYAVRSGRWEYMDLPNLLQTLWKVGFIISSTWDSGLYTQPWTSSGK